MPRPEVQGSFIYCVGVGSRWQVERLRALRTCRTAAVMVRRPYADPRLGQKGDVVALPFGHDIGLVRWTNGV